MKLLLLFVAVLVPASLLSACSDHAKEHASADTKKRKNMQALIQRKRQST